MMLYNKTNLHIDIGEELKDSKNAQTCDKDQITTQVMKAFLLLMFCSANILPPQHYRTSVFMLACFVQNIPHHEKTEPVKIPSETLPVYNFYLR